MQIDGGRSKRRRMPRSRWRRHRRLRRLAVASLVGLAAVSFMREVDAAAPDAAGVAMAIAARDLATGTALEQDDVAVTSVAADSPLAPSALQPQDVVGGTTAGPVEAGEPITSTRLQGETRRPGFTTMPVAFSDPYITEFLSAGMLVDLIWTPGEFSEEASRIIARSARIVRIAAPGNTPAAGLPVLIELSEGDAVAVAAAMSSGTLSVLVSPS